MKDWRLLEGSCACQGITYIWHDRVKPTWVCRDCGNAISWGEE